MSASQSSLNAFRSRLQETLMEQHPGEVMLGTLRIPCAIAPRTMGIEVGDGRTRQLRSLVFLVKKADLDLALIRDLSKASQPLRTNLIFVHVETGLRYLLTNEWSEPNSVNRRLECSEAE